MSSENGSAAASTPSRNETAGHEDSFAFDRAAPRQGLPSQQNRRSLAQLKRRVHGLVVLFFVLDDHARSEEVFFGGAIQQVEYPAAYLVVKGPGLDRRQ